MCCKQGYRDVKHFDETDKKRTPRALSRCGCPALLQVELQASTGLWFVKNFVDQHSHPFINPELSPFLWSHRGMTDPQKADVIEYSVGGLRTHQIMDVMEKQAGGLGKVGFISRDLYNHVALEKKKKIEGSDAQFMLNYMTAQQMKDPDFFYRYTTDSDGHLQNIFWADAQSRLDYVAFGGVVVFDSTYRSNKYRLPFVPFVGLNHHRSTIVFGVGLVSDESADSYEWLLQVFLEAMHQKHPISAITDGDASMAKAISSVWPSTYHRLCSWHIEQNMVLHLRKEKLKEFRKFIYYAMEVHEFERRWLAYKKRFRITRKKKDAWIHRMYELREKWSVAYNKGRYFLGMLSNQRSESLNSRLHVHLNRRMKLVDLVQHVEHCVSVLRRNEAALDAVASHTIPFTRLTADPLEISASSIYTPVMFSKVKAEIVNLSRWNVLEVEEDTGLVSYGVARKESVHVRFHVTCIFDGSKMESAYCCCRKMESEDFPCAHIFCVLKYNGICTIPACCVKARWTMQAKPAFRSVRSANTHIWSEQMDKYHELCNMASEALFTASASEMQSEKVMEYLRSILDEGNRNDGNTGTPSFVPMPAYFSGARQWFTDQVQDPKPIINPKGRPAKESNKRLKPFLENLKAKKNDFVMETHIDIAVMQNGMQGSTWPDTQVASWPIKDYEVPQQTDGCSCALWVLKFIQYWTGVRLSAIFNQDDIRQFRRWLAAALLNSPHNELKVRKAIPAVDLEDDLEDLDLGGDDGHNDSGDVSGDDGSAL